MGNVIIKEQHLNDVAAAIRGKNGTETKYKPSEMAEAIKGLSTGGEDIPDEAFVFSGSQIQRFEDGQFDWFVEKYGNRIRTENLTSCVSMFGDSNLKEIPFSFNFSDEGFGSNSASYIFEDSAIEKAPYLSGIPRYITSIFSGCEYLTEIPEDWAEKINWENMRDSYYSGGIVRECKRLRKVPESLIAELWYKNETTPYYQVPSYYTFYSCYLLDEVKNFPVSPVKINSNGHFSCFLNRCFLLKSFTFAPYEGEVDWNMILIDLKESVGHSVYSTLREYGVPDDKKVSSAEDYERLKNDPDWYTSTYSYSKYNKISAIETINSLPKVTGACTINFKGRAGELTDGGAINTMTEEEIAVATEKGWNVTFS